MPQRPLGSEVAYTRPPPPRVPADAEKPEQLRFIWRWYRAACASRGVEVKALRDPLANVNKRYFEDALEVFLGHDIRPGVWCSWMVDRVLGGLPTHARHRWVPVPKVVLSTRMLTERRWMYRKEEPADAVPTLVRSAAGEELASRFARFESVALCTRPRTPEAIAALERKHFPEGLLAARHRAREKTNAEWQEVLAQIGRGNWLWPVKG